MKRLPNLLSLLRIVVLTPAMVAVACASGSRTWFLAFLGVALVTDALDGYLARQLNAQSDLGRRLDSWGDYLMTAAAAVGVWRLWPEVVHREWPWFVAVLVGCFAIVTYGLVRWRRVLGYHTWLAKMMAVLLPVTLVVLLAGWSAVPFHVAVVLQALCALEEQVIAFLLPGYSGEVASMWHARRMRYDNRGSTGAA